MTLKLIGVMSTLITAVMGATFWTTSQTYQVTGYFVSAEGVVPGNNVTMGGITVGSVKQVAVIPDDQLASGGAAITMEVDSKYAPLALGTRATIRPQGLLGSRFVELAPGSPGGGSIRNGGSIPLHDTAAPVDLDQVQNVFNDQVSARIKTLNLEGGKTFANDNGAKLNQLLAALPAITSNSSDVTANLAAQDQQLSQLTLEFDQITLQMASEDANLRGDLANGASILNSIAAHDQQLRSELVYANSSLGTLNKGLNGHQQDLHQMFLDFPGLLMELHAFNDNSATALSTIYPCIDDVLQTIREMQSATKYSQKQGATDGTGNMLRVYPILQGTTNGSFAPQTDAAYAGRNDATCTGARP